MRYDAQTGFSRRLRMWVRIFLAGPMAIIVTLALLAGMPLWLPGGAAGIDNLVFPLVLAPLIWAALFFHACLDQSIARVGIIFAALFLVHGGLIAWRFLGHGHGHGHGHVAEAVR